MNATRANLTSVDTTSAEYVQQALVPRRSETHGGEDVPLYASGPMAHLFSSTLEQNVIPHVMAYASCVGANRQHCAESPNNDDDVSGSPSHSLQTRAVLPLVFIFCSFEILKLYFW